MNPTRQASRPRGSAWRHFVTEEGDTAVVAASAVDAILQAQADTPGREVYGHLLGGGAEDAHGRYIVVEHVLFPLPEHVRATACEVEVSPEGSADLAFRAREDHPSLRTIGSAHTHPEHGAFLSEGDRSEQRASRWAVNIVVSTAGATYGELAVFLGIEPEGTVERPVDGAEGYLTDLSHRLGRRSGVKVVQAPGQPAPRRDMDRSPPLEPVPTSRPVAPERTQPQPPPPRGRDYPARGVTPSAPAPSGHLVILAAVLAALAFATGLGALAIATGDEDRDSIRALERRMAKQESRIRIATGRATAAQRRTAALGDRVNRLSKAVSPRPTVATPQAPAVARQGAAGR